MVLTFWLPMMAAPSTSSGGFRVPALSLPNLGRRASWSRSQVRSLVQLRKHLYEVCHGGRSWGSIRHGQPERSRYRMAFTTSRSSTERGRPPGLASGSRGARISHWASVKSVGYGFRSIP